MDLFLVNLTSPPLLFFILGAAAALFRSDLEIPEPVAKLISLYLLMAIGLKGGVALSKSGIDEQVMLGLGIAIFLSVLTPLIVYLLARRWLTVADAAATAATYGSISAVTFVTATSYLDAIGEDWNGYLVAAMALMESPAIIIGLMLYRRGSGAPADDSGPGIIRESFLNGSVFLLLGSLIIGWIIGPGGKAQLTVFVEEMFIGALCLFLLDMGIVAMRRFRDMGHSQSVMKLAAFAISMTIMNAILALGLVIGFGLPEGDALLLVVLAASASYIAVPAAMRLALPEANPGVYLGMSLAVTFPFNLLIGIPTYHKLIELLG